MQGMARNLRVAYPGAICFGTSCETVRVGTGGKVGKVVMAVAALTLLLLTALGVYLAAGPLFVRREKAKARTVIISAPFTEWRSI